ncbi:MAG: glucose-6-phosphate dehydrogenase [Spirochaetales bacterium]|nr:glucose-6-phosphate dehydrogenase [Spirochaetales bacterium]
MVVKNTAVVILGASGDLAQRKLIPALSALYDAGEIDDTIRIIGSGRTELTDEEFREKFNLTGGFRNLLSYHTGMEGLRSYIESAGAFEHIVFFLALPPKVYADTAASLYEEGFRKNVTLIIEKPFGYDYQSAQELNRRLNEYFDESQIFRIDHYLAKEAVQNILVFRFANSIFYPIWNANYIESIQINAFEQIGVEDRGAYFDGAGMIRDMVQNHLMQMICLLTMEAPVSLDAEDIRTQKMSVLKALEVEECYRAQYEGYRDEPGIASDSQTETYAEMKLKINNFRWNGMPIYLRAGKALHRKGTEIGFKFRRLPKLLFNRDGSVEPNTIIFQIQPSEGIVVDLSSKIPGNESRITRTNMKFCYSDSFSGEIPEAYQKLLLDALKGNRTLFVSAEEAEISWRKMEKVLDKGELTMYPRGRMPVSRFQIDWIDFDRFCPVCP